MRAEVAALLDMVSGVLGSVPPRKPLQDWERAILQTPTEEVFYLYGGNLSPEWSLTIAAGAIALGRWREYQATRERPLGAPSSTSEAAP